MDKKLFNDIKAGLAEAIAYERGEVTIPPARIHTFKVPDVKAIRASTGLSQSKFAERFGFSVRTLQHWEAQRRNPVGPAATLLWVIAKAPDTVAKVVEEHEFLEEA